MSGWKRKLASITIVTAAIAAGCGDDAGNMTKDKENAIRNPTASPNYKGPDPEAVSRMNQEIAEYQNKHKNDKVEFNIKK